MSKEKEELTREVESLFKGWSIGDKAKQEIAEKYLKKKPETEEKKEGEVIQSKPIPSTLHTQTAQQSQLQQVIEEKFKSIEKRMFSKSEKKIYDLLLTYIDFFRVTSPLSQQNICDILKQKGDEFTLRTIKRGLKNLLVKGIVSVETSPEPPTIGTRYKVIPLKEYLTQLLSKGEQKQ